MFHDGGCSNVSLDAHPAYHKTVAIVIVKLRYHGNIPKSRSTKNSEKVERVCMMMLHITSILSLR